MPHTVEHSGQIFTALRVEDNLAWWPVRELLARRPNICEEAASRYRIDNPNGIPEGTAQQNCNCPSCLKAWQITTSTVETDLTKPNEET